MTCVLYETMSRSWKITIYRDIGLVKMVISTNSKPTIYRNLYGNTDRGLYSLRTVNNLKSLVINISVLI